jgi:hypothetical protein
MTTVRWACVKYTAGRYWKVHYHGDYPVYRQEARADGFPECVAFYQGEHWWITTIPVKDGQISQRGLPKWLAKGTHRLVAHPVCDMAALNWRMPAYCTKVQPYVSAIPNREAQHIVYKESAASYEAQAAGLRAELAQLQARNDVLYAENMLLKGYDVSDPAPEPQEAEDPATEPQEAGTWSDAEWLEWRKSRSAWNPSVTKTGWMNKCVALLGALKVNNQGRINHLCDTPLSCFIMSSCCIVICINTCDV